MDRRERRIVVQGRPARRAESGAIVFDQVVDAPPQDLFARIAALEERVQVLEGKKPAKRKA